MAAKNYIKVALVTLLIAVFVISAVPCVLATDTVVEETSGENVLLVAPAESESESAEDTAMPESEAETEASEAETEESGAETEAVTEETAEKGGLTTGTIVSIVIVAVIVIAAAVYCIKNREKVAKFFREVRSECKKIVWTPWKTVRKNTFVVVIIVVICAIVIGALDLLFSKGIISLGDLF